MELRPRKKRVTNFSSTKEVICHKKSGQNKEIENVKAKTFPILELPTHLVYDILSRLPLKTIFESKRVCKKFLELFKDPYFAQRHLIQSPNSTTGLICLLNMENWGTLYFYMFDPDENSITTSCSIDPTHGPQYPPHSLTKSNANFCFTHPKLAVIGSCNGLLCLYSAAEKPLYMICNPLLKEYMVLPPVTPSTPDYTYLNKSTFGYSSKTKQYKVLRFMSSKSVEPAKMVVEIHTLGTNSWRRIDETPKHELRESFDPCLNGVLHWVTEGKRSSDLISSFNLETECFKNIPPPSHFNEQFISKISWMGMGILSGCISLCYVYKNELFEVWQMKEYNVEESWTNVCKIEMKMYCGLKTRDFRRPLKFTNNGDLWIICSSYSLLAYSPKKGTFREYKSLGYRCHEAITHVPSFVSLKVATGDENLKVESLAVFKP